MSSVDTVDPPLTPVPPVEGIARVTPLDTVSPPTGSTAAVKYIMQGEDAVTNGLYTTWFSTGAPDLAGAFYPANAIGPAGLNTPLRKITTQQP